MPQEKNIPLAKDLLLLMQSTGKSIINNTETTDSFAKHIQEITSLGYKGNIHGNFARFICRHSHLATGDKDRWTGEILVDWVVLDTARCLTSNKFVQGINVNKFRSALSFQPPDFHLIPNPGFSTPVYFTFGLSKIYKLVLSGQYDDIFNKILLWRTLYEEPFHKSIYGLNIRSVAEFIQAYIAETLSNDTDMPFELTVDFFKNKENLDKFLQYQKNKSIEREEKNLEQENQRKRDKEEAGKRSEIAKQQEIENRLNKLKKENIMGQKQKDVVIEMLDGKIYGKATTTGNNAAWICPCGNPTPLIGRTYGTAPQSDNVVICRRCKKYYFLVPVDGKSNKPPAKIIETSADYAYQK